MPHEPEQSEEIINYLDDILTALDPPKDDTDKPVSSDTLNYLDDMLRSLDTSQDDTDIPIDDILRSFETPQDDTDIPVQSENSQSYLDDMLRSLDTSQDDTDIPISPDAPQSNADNAQVPPETLQSKVNNAQVPLDAPQSNADAPVPPASVPHAPIPPASLPTAPVQSAPVPSDAPQSRARKPGQQNTAQKTAQPAAENKPLYPEATLSEKQMAALYSVIQPTGKQGPGQTDSAKDAAKGSAELKIKDRSIVKTVFLVTFLVIVISAAGLAGLYYWWTNYATFEHTLQPVVILEGQHVAPHDFLDPEEEHDGIDVVFQNPAFEPAAGVQFVPLTLTMGLRTVDDAALLCVLTPVDFVQHEFKESEPALKLSDFITNNDAAVGVSFDIRFAEEPLPLEDYPIGEFPLLLSLNGVPFEVLLKVVDTTPPTATVVEKTIQIGESVSPEDFMTDISDASEIKSVTFVEEPNVFARDDQRVQIEIEDIYGNSSVFTADLFILVNQAPPVIDITTDTIESRVGAVIDYLQGVSAHDDFGRELEVQVDSSAVDVSKEGTYTAVLWVDDYSGNHSDVEVTIHVIGVDPEEVYKQIDEILARILDNGMSQEKKVVAIHNWVRWNNSKAATGDRSGSIIAEANKALKDKRGDSHVYSSISSLMLTRAGIPNMRIERVTEADTEHFWLLVNPDELGWHHFDPFPTGHVLGDLTAMFTDAQAKDIARKVQSHSGIKDYYTYDASLYPEVVKE